jgi:DNA-binding response OmpR family regulator
MITTKIDILKIGADDYITKPFDLGEVVARIEVVLRRSRQQSQAENLIRYKDILLDKESKRVFIGETEIDLTAKEYQILEMLICNRNRILTKANFYETIWKEEFLGDDNAVKTHMSNLRSKLKTGKAEEEYIETVWGLGYRLFRE